MSKLLTQLSLFYIACMLGNNLWQHFITLQAAHLIDWSACSSFCCFLAWQACSALRFFAWSMVSSLPCKSPMTLSYNSLQFAWYQHLNTSAMQVSSSLLWSSTNTLSNEPGNGICCLCTVVERLVISCDMLFEGSVGFQSKAQLPCLLLKSLRIARLFPPRWQHQPLVILCLSHWSWVYHILWLIQSAVFGYARMFV